MEGQQRIQELLNKISFLRKALEYYGKNSTYASTQGVAPIDVDRGHQARFALDQTKEIEEYNKSLIKDFKNAIKNDLKGDTPEERMEELQEKISEIYKTMDKYGDKNI